MLNTTATESPRRAREFAFGPFVADAVKRTLARDGRPVAITSKTFDVLLALLDGRDRLLSKDELLARVWPDAVVGENNLARQISSLRRVLGQRPDQHDYLITVPGSGYRFVAAVRELPPAEPESPDLPGAEPSFGGEPHGSARSATGGDRDAIGERELVAEAASGAAAAGLRGAKLGWAAAAVVLAVCVLLALAAFGLLRPADPVLRRTLHRITFDDVALPRQPAWSPDGVWVAYTSDRAGNADIWKQRVGDPDPVRLTTSAAHESQPQWSPDGQQIVYRSERDGGGLYVIPANGGAERLVAGFGYEPRWSPDGRNILFRRSSVISDVPSFYVAGLDGLPPRPLRPDLLERFSSARVAWYPDSQRVSVWGTLQSGSRAFYTVPLGMGAPSVPLIGQEVERGLATLAPGQFLWAPSRRYIYFEASAGDARNVWRVAVDPATEAWSAGPERLTTGTGEETHLAISSDGTRLLFTALTTRTSLWAFRLDSKTGRVSGEAHALTDGSMGEVDFDLHPDGSRIAYRTERAGNFELRERWISDGTERRLLSSRDWKLVKPRWSANGRLLAFARCPADAGPVKIAVLDAEGGDERVIRGPDGVEVLLSDWANDGQSILGACRTTGSNRSVTCLIPVADAQHAGGPQVRVLASDPARDLYNQRFSPDQRWITFLAHDLQHADTSTVYVMPASGGPWRAITDGTTFDDKPRWGPDGQILYFVSRRSGTSNVWGRRFDPEAGRPLGDAFPVTTFASAQFQLSPQTVEMDIAITATDLLLPMTESHSDLWMLDQIDR